MSLTQNFLTDQIPGTHCSQETRHLLQDPSLCNHNMIKKSSVCLAWSHTSTPDECRIILDIFQERAFSVFHCTCIVKLLGLPFQQAGARHAVLLPLTLPSLLLFFLKPLGMCVCLIAQDSQFFDEVYCACIVSVLGVCRAGKGVSSSSSCSNSDSSLGCYSRSLVECGVVFAAVNNN